MKAITEISGSNIYNTMLDFIKIGWRRPGTRAHNKAANYILNKFNEFELEETVLEPFKMLFYDPKKWELTVKCESLPKKEIKIESFPFWHAKSSEVDGTEAEIVHIGWGTPLDFKKMDVQNKIVLIDSMRMMSFYPTMDFYRSYEKARKAGALGLISIDDVPPNTIFAEYATRHQTLKDSDLESGSIPALHIGYESGAYLKALLQSGEDVRVNLLLETDIKPAMTENLIGTLPGRKKDDIILIGTHIDSWFDGAIDNAGGNAGFIEIADYYSQLSQDQREKTMVFAGFAGHEVGSIGVIEFARKHQDWFHKISTYCMLDGFGSKGYVLESPSRGIIETGLDEAKALFTTDNQVLFDIICEAVERSGLKQNGPLMYASAVMGPYSDLGPLVVSNVPSIMIIGKGIFYHTIEDTADKVLPEQLERTTRAHVEILNRLHETPANDIKMADRKGLNIPKKLDQGKRGPVYFNFNITPNPVVKGTTTLIYLTSYRCTDRIIVDAKWNIENLELHAPICPYSFRKLGLHKIKLTLFDEYGNEYHTEKYAYVINKPK